MCEREPGEHPANEVSHFSPALLCEHPASHLRTPGPRLIIVMSVSGCVDRNPHGESLPKITRDSGGAPACASREQMPLL